MSDLKKELDELRDISAAGGDINAHPAQAERREKAGTRKCAPLSIDRENQTGTFQGSKGGVYRTSLTECSCRDFMMRQFPCKHMYRLRHELGLSSLTEAIERHKDDVYVDPETKVPEIITQLSHDEQCELCVLLGQWIYAKGGGWKYKSGESMSTHFMNMGLMVENPDPVARLKALSFGEIRKALTEAGHTCPRTIAEAAPLVLQYCPDVFDQARKKAVNLVFADWLMPIRGKLRSALANLIGNELYDFDDDGHRFISWKLHTR
ncbi:MAG: SWIM zinc finger family protein [Pyramidobacter sp.]|nr:SWIM zinc finger family protein [Pyramidobacter sp.]